MKAYKLSFQDKKSNEIFFKEVTASNIKEARSLAARMLAELCDNDVIKVITHLK